MTTAPPPIIRDATDADLPAIFDIYHEQVATGSATFDTTPRTPEQQRAWMDAHRSPNRPVIVATDSAGAVLGWASVNQWSDRRAYDRTGEISIYIRAGMRGMGIGRLLMRQLIDRATAAGLCVLLARVTEGNPASLNLHLGHGFVTVGIMHRVGEKFGRIYDVRLLELHIDGWSPAVQS
ncbi:MAG: GNAT family N-acetyltransferase [Planctomyces sp.]|nr:GNAT family N-acetyltransferase [Planctomyces sp.]MBA4119189.1 GNAT family N-acetyltransferase [Isosphaera sp.]